VRRAAVLLLLAATACGDEDAPPPARAASSAAARDVDPLAGWADAVPDAPTAKAPGFAKPVPEIVVRRADGARMHLVPAGEVAMGGGATPPEQPARRVRLTNAYYVDETEVTVEQWRKSGLALQHAALETAPPPTRHPRTLVSVRDAHRFAAWATCSLPTEAQWEHAAHGGSAAAFPWGDEDDATRRNGPGTKDGFERLAPVASFAPNGYGLFDVVGNAAEICEDAYAPTYLADLADGAADPLRTESAEADARSLRGGSCTSTTDKLRIAARGFVANAGGNASVGFRCVHELKPPR
jgi:formylglycine-generating enzyme required for sulfatase activity